MRQSQRATRDFLSSWHRLDGDRLFLRGATPLPKPECNSFAASRSIAFSPTKRDVLRALIGGVNPYALGLPPALVNRALVELKAVGVVEKDDRKAELSDFAKELLIGAGLLSPKVAIVQMG